MNILYIIGNGFDINLGLRTDYQEFYDYYIAQKSDSDVIAKMKEHLTKHRYTTWADLELGMGSYTNNVGSWKEMEEICHDFSIKLRSFLSQKQKGFSIIEPEKRKMLGFILNPQKGLTAGSERAVSNFLVRDKSIQVISFNYTKTFEQLCDYSGNSLSLSPYSVLQVIHHIHLSLDNTDVVLGVNDEGQIKNKDIICPELLDILVKPHINNQLGTLVDNECSSLISNADLICLFGVSLGETDNIWWKRIGNRMTNSSARLIYYVYDKDTPHFNNELIGKMRYYRDKIIKRCNLNKENASLMERIFVGYKTDFFKIR